MAHGTQIGVVMTYNEKCHRLFCQLIQLGQDGGLELWKCSAYMRAFCVYAGLKHDNRVLTELWDLIERWQYDQRNAGKSKMPDFAPDTAGLLALQLDSLSGP